MRSDVSDIRYRIGDMMGSYAPDTFRRSSSMVEWAIGLGSILAAAGISYLALRLADRRLQDVISSITPWHAMGNGRERPMVHGTSGAKMPAMAEDGTSASRQHSTEGGKMPGERSQKRS